MPKRKSVSFDLELNTEHYYFASEKLADKRAKLEEEARESRKSIEVDPNSRKEPIEEPIIVRLPNPKVALGDINNNPILKRRNKGK